MFAVLGDRPHWELVLPQGHWSCLLQDGDSLPRDTLGHLTGHCLDNTAGRGDGGKCDRWLLVHACGRAEETRISHCPGLEAGFIPIHTLGLQHLSTTEGQGLGYLETLNYSPLHIYSTNIKNIFLTA